MSSHISMSNLLCNWDRDLLQVIEYLREGKPDNALVRAVSMHRFLTKMKEHCKTCDIRIVDDI